MWPLSVGSDLDNMLILSFVEQTRVLSLIGEEVIIRIYMNAALSSVLFSHWPMGNREISLVKT